MKYHYFMEEYMFNQVEILKGLQARSSETGMSKGDLVSLGCLVIIRTAPEKLLRVFESVQCLERKEACS